MEHRACSHIWPLSSVKVWCSKEAYYWFFLFFSIHGPWALSRYGVGKRHCIFFLLPFFGFSSPQVWCSQEACSCMYRGLRMREKKKKEKWPNAHTETIYEEPPLTRAIYMYVCMMYVCMYACMYVYVCIYMYVCICVCVCVCVCVCIHIYIYYGSLQRPTNAYIEPL